MFSLRSNPNCPFGRGIWFIRNEQKKLSLTLDFSLSLCYILKMADKKTKTTNPHQKPKNFDDGVFLYYPKALVDKIDFVGEARKMNKSERITRKINAETLKMNYILLLNFFSHEIKTFSDDKQRHTHISLKKIRQYCCDKYYRICIELMKKHKVLYVKVWNGRETYKVGEYSKAYRWNTTEYWIKDMSSEIGSFKVTEYRNKQKILDNLEILQCFSYCKPFMEKQKRKVSKFKKPKGFNKGGRGLMAWFKDSKFVRKWSEHDVYVDQKRMKSITHRKKYGLQRHFCKTFGVTIRLDMLGRLSLTHMKELASKFDDYLCSRLRGKDILAKFGDGIDKIFRVCENEKFMFSY